MAANGAQTWWVSCTFLSQCITESPVSDETVPPAAIIRKQAIRSALIDSKRTQQLQKMNQNKNFWTANHVR